MIFGGGLCVSIIGFDVTFIGFFISNCFGNTRCFVLLIAFNIFCFVFTVFLIGGGGGGDSLTNFLY